jgi:hypothetical protein
MMDECRLAVPLFMYTKAKFIVRRMAKIWKREGLRRLIFTVVFVHSISCFCQDLDCYLEFIHMCFGASDEFVEIMDLAS